MQPATGNGQQQDDQSGQGQRATNALVRSYFPVGRRVGPADVRARVAGRRVGLCMSAGFFGFYGHVGFLQALDELGIRVAAVSGSSAGAMTAAFYAAGMPTEEMVRRMLAIRRDEFWDPQSPLAMLRALLTGGRGFMGLLKGQLLREGLARELAIQRFEQARIPIATVSTNITRRARHVDTRGELAEAVAASASFPLLFAPVPRSSGDHWDGGIVDKAPITALLQLEKLDAVILHYLPPSTLRKPHGFHLRGALSGWRALDAAIDVLRHRDTLQQVALAAARGVDVIIASPRLPRMGPSRMHLAHRALRAGRLRALAEGSWTLVEGGTALHP